MPRAAYPTITLTPTEFSSLLKGGVNVDQIADSALSAVWESVSFWVDFYAATSAVVVLEEMDAELIRAFLFAFRRDAPEQIFNYKRDGKPFTLKIRYQDIDRGEVEVLIK